LKGALLFNKYYTDEGQDYVQARLTECFSKRGVCLHSPVVYAQFGGAPKLPEIDFVIFWDKDVVLAKCLEQSGVRVFNNSFALEHCDDKSKTYVLLSQAHIPLIPTVFAPLKYAAAAPCADKNLLSLVENAFGYPLIVKQNIGSLGKQVSLIKTRAQLETAHKRLLYIPHQYQKLIGKRGEDIRVYTVGGKAIAAFKRTNTASFTANAATGGKTEITALTESLKHLSETAAKALRLDFGAIDFLEENGQYYFLEANSNAYFKAAEAAGIEIADKIVNHIILSVNSPSG